MSTIPKRTEERLGHRTKAENDVTKAAGAAEVVQPEGDPTWTPEVRELWESLGKSGQSRYYEPSDWAELRIVCWFISSKIAGGRMSGQDLASAHQALADHLVSDGARRRLRLELQRPKASKERDVPAGVTDLDRRRAALA